MKKMQEMLTNLKQKIQQAMDKNEKKLHYTNDQGQTRSPERLEKATNKAVLDAKAPSIKKVEALTANQK